MLVYQKIATIRRQKQLTTTQLAELLGISQTTVSRYEKGIIKYIPREMLQRIAEVLDVAYEELIQDDPRYNEESTGKHAPYTRLEEIESITQQNDALLLDRYHLLPPELQDIIQRICDLAVAK